MYFYQPLLAYHLLNGYLPGSRVGGFGGTLHYAGQSTVVSPHHMDNGMGQKGAVLCMLRPSVNHHRDFTSARLDSNALLDRGRAGPRMPGMHPVSASLPVTNWCIS